MHSVAKFKLHFDKEELIFKDGEYITGFLELVLNEDLKYKSITFELKGYSVISWDGVIGTSPSSDPASTDIYREHCSEKCIMLDKIGNFLDKDPILQAGEHMLPFEVKIPKDVPSSFEGQYGRIRYEGRGVVERPSSGFKTHKNIYGRCDLVVLAALDLNSIPEAFFKIEICKYKELGLCCTEGSLTIDWLVDRSGFIPTEEITINGSIQNDSKHAVTNSSVSLIMVVEYRLKKKRLIDRVRIANMEKGSIGTDDVTVWNDRLLVPSCPPSSLGRSKTVDISYELEFKVTLEGSHASPITYTKTVYVGTVKLAQQTSTSHKPQFLTAYPPAFVAAETTLLVPCYAQVQSAGVVLTSPPRTNDLTGFYGNHNAGFDSFSRGDGDIPLEDRPPPYAPGHNPDEFDYHYGETEEFFCGQGEPEAVMTVSLTDEPDSNSFAKTLSIRGDLSEDLVTGSDASPSELPKAFGEDVANDDDDDNLGSDCSNAIIDRDGGGKIRGSRSSKHRQERMELVSLSSAEKPLTSEVGMTNASDKRENQIGCTEIVEETSAVESSFSDVFFVNSPDRLQESTDSSSSSKASAPSLCSSGVKGGKS